MVSGMAVLLKVKHPPNPTSYFVQEGIKKKQAFKNARTE